MKRYLAISALVAAFFVVVGLAFANTYNLGPGNDTWTDNDQGNNIYGQGGDDNIYGKGGNDDIFGGPGNDYPMNGNDGNSDRIDGDDCSGGDGLDGGPGMDDTCVVNYPNDYYGDCEVVKQRC